MALVDRFYSLEDAEGQLFFFSTFEGHQQPFRPFGPLTFEDVHHRRVHYRAKLARKEDGAMVYVGLEKLCMVRRALPAPPTAPALYPAYLGAELRGELVQVLDAITPEQAARRPAYVRLWEAEQSVFAVCFEPLSVDRYVYHHDDAGALIEVETTVAAWPEETPPVAEVRWSTT